MSIIKKIGYLLRSSLTFWVSPYNLEHLHSVRLFEFHYIKKFMPAPPHRILELGAGTGWQSKLLSEFGYDVKSIDLPSSNYSKQRIWNVIDYDGINIPYIKGSFDIVFSSNVLEHVLNLSSLQDEIFRILDDDGICIHVMPTSTWRLFTNISHFIKFWNKAPIHGVHSDSLNSEYLFFSKKNWIKIFDETNFELLNVYNIPLFYTGTAVFSNRLSLNLRKILSFFIGGSCNIYILKKRLKSCLN